MKNILVGLLLTFCLSCSAHAATTTTPITDNTDNSVWAQDIISSWNENYAPQITVTSGSSIEIISANDIGARYSEEMLADISLNDSIPLMIRPEWDSRKLADAVHSLKCIMKQRAPQNAKLIFDETSGSYIICKEVEGISYDEEAIIREIQEKLWAGWPLWYVAEMDYLMPDKILSKEILAKLNSGCNLTVSIEEGHQSPLIKEADLKESQKAANQMLQTELTISDTVQQITIDKEVLLQWGILTQQGTINEDAVVAFIEENYDFKTQGLERAITSPATGTFTQGDGVFYGTVDIEKETEKLISEIQEGIREERYPEYVISMEDNDGIGNTFIEVSIEKQKVYLIREGEIEYVADCVTGCESTGHDTPKGICYINSKYRDITLQKYNAFVNFWMAFIGSTYGLHDASWRYSFGEDIYKYDGSHGCVNMKYEDIEYLYNNTDIGIPVIVH